jgi:hypothetical protein
MFEPGKCRSLECISEKAQLLMRLAKVEAERDMLLAGEIPPDIIAKAVGAVGYHAQLYEGYIHRQKKSISPHHQERKSIFSWIRNLV